jgi:glycosyltransferase involved in cell wall biosynthesis
MIDCNLTKITLDQAITVIIPTRNRPEILRRTLCELKERGFESLPLLIYDDASTSETGVAEVAAAEWPTATVYRSDVKRGQAFGRNRLLREATTDWILLLDDDSWPEVRGLLQNAFEDACNRSATVATFQYRALRNGELSHGHLTEVQEVTSFLGGAALLHRERVQQVGGFRDVLVFGFEEPDLAFRLWATDRKMVFYPDVIFTHNQHYTPDEHRDYREYDFLYSRNAILMSSLNFPLWFGLVHGVIRSFRRMNYHKRNYSTKLYGVLCGIALSFVSSNGLARASFGKSIQWLKLQSKS